MRTPNVKKNEGFIIRSSIGRTADLPQRVMREIRPSERACFPETGQVANAWRVWYIICAHFDKPRLRESAVPFKIGCA